MFMVLLVFFAGVLFLPGWLAISNDPAEFYWDLPSYTGFYWVLLGFTGFYWVLLGFNGFHWVLLGFLSKLNGVSWDSDRI